MIKSSDLAYLQNSCLDDPAFKRWLVFKVKNTPVKYK